MKTAAPLFLTLMILGIPSGFASSTDDLASPQQSIRDEAAEALRKSYHEISMAKWVPVTEKIRRGQTKKEILELLRPFRVTQEVWGGSGQSHSGSYRLDNEWILVCWFQNEGNILINRALTRSLKYIWIAPPKEYTGKWITYFINGQKSHEINYKNGRYFGEFISFHSSGSKGVIQNYSEKGANGKDTGYFPSGRVSYRGQYKDGKQVGTWTSYDEDGNLTSTQEHPAEIAGIR